MNDEQIKEILISLINSDKVFLGTSNKEIAENLAEFVNTMRTETNKEL